MSRPEPLPPNLYPVFTFDETASVSLADYRASLAILAADRALANQRSKPAPKPVPRKADRTLIKTT